MWNKQDSIDEIYRIKMANECKKGKPYHKYSLSIHLATHEGAQVASQHCPILLVSKQKISNSGQNFHRNIKQLEVLSTQKPEEAFLESTKGCC